MSDPLAQEAQRAGLLTEAAIEKLLREALRTGRIARMTQARQQLAARHAVADVLFPSKRHRHDAGDGHRCKQVKYPIARDEVASQPCQRNGCNIIRMIEPCCVRYAARAGAANHTRADGGNRWQEGDSRAIPVTPCAVMMAGRFTQMSRDAGHRYQRVGVMSSRFEAPPRHAP